MKAAEELALEGLQSRVISMPTVSPLDTEAVIKAARETSAIFTIEEHSIVGGLGGAVAETLLESGIYPRHFKRIGLKNAFSSVVGDQNYLRSYYGLDAAGIVSSVKSIIR
jgi:transketolase